MSNRTYLRCDTTDGKLRLVPRLKAQQNNNSPSGQFNFINAGTVGLYVSAGMIVPVYHSTSMSPHERALIELHTNTHV